ncbi:hypothetical protein [Nonomuraea dietziae]|uniref:hypothetical protein n=1 Tax=Nonomuraea dietziae TaxID=65515 RepID=UPI0031E447CD
MGPAGELDGLTRSSRERMAFRERYLTEQYGYKLIQSARPQDLRLRHGRLPRRAAVVVHRRLPTNGATPRSRATVC